MRTLDPSAWSWLLAFGAVSFFVAAPAHRGQGTL
jgi:hypothetical protein